MSLQYLLDEDISYRVAEGLRLRSIDAVSVQQIGRANKGIPDEDQLTFATAAERVLVTYNRADYEALDGQWRAQGRTHAGILWCSERSIPRRNIGGLVRALEAAASEYSSLRGLCLPLPRLRGG